MSFHIAAFRSTALAAVANTDVPAITDNVLYVQNGHYIMRQQMSLFKAWAGSATLQRARLDSPIIRLYGNPHIRPVTQSLLPGASPNVAWYNRRPFIVPPGEEIAVQMTGTSAGENAHALVWFFAGAVDPIDPGNVYPVRLTSSTALVAGAWTGLSYTLDQSLPSGVYSMVFSELFSTNGIAHRWIFDEQVWRPGHMSQASEFNQFNLLTYQYPLGKMGRFTNTSLPRLEALGNAADNSHIGYIHLQRMGGQSLQALYPAVQPMLGVAA